MSTLKELFGTEVLSEEVTSQLQEAWDSKVKQLHEEVEANLDRDLQNLVVRVAGAYFETLMADEQLGLVLAQKKTYTALLDASQKSILAGSGDHSAK